MHFRKQIPIQNYIFFDLVFEKFQIFDKVIHFERFDLHKYWREKFFATQKVSRTKIQHNRVIFIVSLEVFSFQKSIFKNQKKCLFTFDRA